MVTIQHREIMEGRGAHVIVEGPLSGGAAVDLDAYIGDLMGKGIRTVVIDGGRMEFVSSAGLGSFVIINKKLRSAGGSLAVFSLNEETMTLFRLLGFDREIPVVGNLAEAINASAVSPERPNTFPERARRIDVDPAERPARAPEPEGGAAEYGAARSVLPRQEPMEQSPQAADPPRESPLPPTAPEETPLVFDNPIIVECRRCGSLVRVRQSGDYGCPDCNTEFTVMKDMTVLYGCVTRRNDD